MLWRKFVVLVIFCFQPESKILFQWLAFGFFRFVHQQAIWGLKALRPTTRLWVLTPLLFSLFNFGSVQFSSVTQSCLILCDRMNRSTPGLPVHSCIQICCFFLSFLFSSTLSLLSTLGWRQLKYLSRSMIKREYFLNQQNPLELFRVSPVLRFPVLFFLDSISWNGAFGSGTPDSIVQAGRTGIGLP